MINTENKNTFTKTHTEFIFLMKFCSISVIIIFSLFFSSCKKEKGMRYIDPSDNLAIDSIIATKRNIVTWEEIFITVYTRGNHLVYHWNANHGSMVSEDSATVMYYACDACVGLNTIECKVSNEYGIVSDTLMIRVNQ